MAAAKHPRSFSPVLDSRLDLTEDPVNMWGTSSPGDRVWRCELGCIPPKDLLSWGIQGPGLRFKGGGPPFLDLGSHLMKPLILGLKVHQCPQGIPEMSLLGQLLKRFKGEDVLQSPFACTFQGETSQRPVFKEDHRQVFTSQGCLF